MYIISSTIKMKFLKPILDGYKLREYKAATPYWDKRIYKANVALAHGQDVFLSLLCGQHHHTWRVDTDFIERIKTPEGVKDTVTTPTCYAVPIGEEVILVKDLLIQKEFHDDLFMIDHDMTRALGNWLMQYIGKRVYIVVSRSRGFQVKEMTEAPKGVMNPVMRVGE